MPKSEIFGLSFTNFLAESAIGEIVEEGAFLAEKFKEFVENPGGRVSGSTLVFGWQLLECPLRVIDLIRT